MSRTVTVPHVVGSVFRVHTTSSVPSGLKGAAHQVAVRVLALFVLCGHRVEPDEARLRSWYVAAWSAK